MSRTTSHDQRAGEATETVAIIIPTLNEERSIGTVIDGVPVADLLQNGLKTAVYVVDGRSVDHTREIAVQKGAHIIRERRRGKSTAIQTAFRAVDADYVIVLDGDHTYPISMAPEMVRLLQTTTSSSDRGCKESLSTELCSAVAVSSSAKHTRACADRATVASSYAGEVFVK